MAKRCEPIPKENPGKEAHAFDLEALGKLHCMKVGTADGGRCLTRHVESGEEYAGSAGVHWGKRLRYLKAHTCNHRWQGYRRALKDARIYNGDGNHASSPDRRWYEPFGEQKRLTILARAGVLVRLARPPPKLGDWDVCPESEAGTKSLNYRTAASVPFWHEAHHIIANAELRKGIETKLGDEPLAPELIAKFCQGLLKAGYNLNHQDNMILLPIERRFSRAIGLPAHRDTPNIPSHTIYSEYVKEKLAVALNPVQEKLDPKKHQRPLMRDCRKEIEAISTAIRAEIEAKGRCDRGASLNETFRDTGEM